MNQQSINQLMNRRNGNHKRNSGFGLQRIKQLTAVAHVGLISCSGQGLLTHTNES